MHVVKHAPLVSIDLIVTDAQGKVLLGKRKNDPAQGLYFVPGGRIFKDERIPVAFQRFTQSEIHQEMGIDKGRFLGVYEHLYAKTRWHLPSIITHYIVLAYVVDGVHDPVLKPDDQHFDWQWMDPASIREADSVHPNAKAYFPHDS
jgi:colanic acid biosynthesis protein WcaH